MEETMITLSILLIILNVFLFILGIGVCYAIISMKDAINDIADVYCKLNKAQYKNLIDQEHQNQKEQATQED